MRPFALRRTLTGHKQSQAVTVVVWKMVAQKQSPVFGEKMKGRLELSLGVLAAHTESPVNQLQQTGSLRKRGMSFVQPLGQVKLQTRGTRDKVSICEKYLELQLWSFHHIGHNLMLANLCKQHEDDIGGVHVQGRHHVLVEEDELLRRSVGGEERRDERAETPLLQDCLQDAATFFGISLNEHLCTTQAGGPED